MLVRKHVLLFLFVFSITVSSLAQNNLRILSKNGVPIKVYVNSKLQNEIPQVDLLIEAILQDSILIQFEYENKQNFNTQLFLLNKGQKDKYKEYSYFVWQNKGELKLLFDGISEITDLPKPIVPAPPKSDTIAKVNRFEHLCELKSGELQFFNNLPKQSTCKSPMPSSYIAILTDLIKKNQKGEDRLFLAQEICKNNCLSLFQLKAILALLEVEFDKLMVAKLGYFNLVDTTHQYELLQSFKFEASLKDLRNFLMHAKDFKSIYSFDCTVTTDDQFMNAFIQKQSEAGNDSYRLDLLKKNYYNYCFSIHQISKILDTYIHDREKLSAAKLLYFKCSEKSNYLKLKESFSYSIASKELEDFIIKQTR